MMITVYYSVMFLLAALLGLIYVFKWHKHFNHHMSMVFMLIPIVILGYIFFSASKSLDEAITATKIIYMGGCFLLLIITLVIFDLCNLTISRWKRLGLFIISSLAYGMVLSCDQNTLFYRHVDFNIINGNVVLTKEYGPLHSLFYVLLIFYFSIDIWSLVYSYYNKKDVSNKIVTLLFVTVTISISCYVVQRFLHLPFDLEPVAYVLSEIVYLIINRQLNLYDINDNVIDSLVQRGDVGFVSFGFNYNYLGSNESARQIFPELNDIKIDTNIENTKLKYSIYQWLRTCNEENSTITQKYEKDDSHYLVDINYLYEGQHKRGYQLFITDDTKNQKYINLLNNFNQKLQSEVEDKTRHIVEMNDSFIMGMATMVESRDNSTGGHIKRTSEGVRILTDEIKKNNTLNLSDEFIRKLIKAAPMHDLGKIAVDDAILRKPGRFTPEEFEIMKKHAPEGAKIVHKVLEQFDDEQFRQIAENVAHYHHERIDGSGYPNGLKGDEIPIEARIMAIADVYDALVSKRVYKESMSFEKANEIIMEDMGRHFDSKLKPFYLAAREKLETFYSSQE